MKIQYFKAKKKDEFTERQMVPPFQLTYPFTAHWNCFSLLDFRMNPNRKRKTYSENDIEKALRMTRQGVSIRQAARRHGIPAETLRDKVREKYPLGAKPGKDPVLTKQEETKIVSWVTSIARAGFPVSIKQLRISVGQFVRQTRKHTPFRNGIPGKKWVMLFLKRHPEISVRTPSVLARYRATITMEQIKGWFGEVHVYLEQDNLIHLLDCPDRVFNLDETSFDLVVKKRKCLAMKQSKHVYSVFGNNDKESYTALFTASASGVLLPPLVLFPYKQRIPGGIALTAPPDWGIGRTESGWMTGNAFYDFLKNVFQPWLVREGIPLPVLLFVDGHKSHATLMSTNFCKDHGIILICLFPNSTHLTQPLDVSFFRPMKQYWYDALSTFRANHGMRTIARTEICPLLKTAIEEFNNKEQVIVSGFRKSGLYPWKPEAVNFAAMPTNEVLQNENTTAIPDPVQEDRTFFHAFEARLSADQLKEFRKQEGSECWRGATEETNLFQFWKNWKREYENHNGSDDENDFLGFPEGEYLT
ncbi:uncharacterized protein LOC134286347 [Aedes albopictus]|uniref:HTH CENPB-type domain-containing protein n=1 Tax=Aedes albopictus TaxID=7160 RepID=A0ABM1Z5E1_AEDAL